MPETALLYHRDRRGALQAVLPFSQLEWTHRFAASGGFRLSMPLEAGASVQCGDGIDIELDGRVDFSGVVQSRELAYAPEREPSWELRGLDLTWWLHQRVIVPPAGASHDEQIGVPAETAIRHYIDAHLLHPADPARAIAVAATLAPATLASANRPPLGPPVSVRARYNNLAREVERIAALGDVGFGASRGPDGAIRFGVRAPRDRTAASATPVIISPHLGTAAALSYSEGGAQGRNAVCRARAGRGHRGRPRRGALRRALVADADAIAGHGRRESSLDARDAGDREGIATRARDAGLADAAVSPPWPVRRGRCGASSHCRSLRGWRPSRRAPAPSRSYPGDWQVGDRVSIDLPDLELRFDRRSRRCGAATRRAGADRGRPRRWWPTRTPSPGTAAASRLRPDAGAPAPDAADWPCAASRSARRPPASPAGGRPRQHRPARPGAALRPSVEAVRVRADAGEAIAVDCAFGAPAPDAADTLRRIAERTTPARFA